MQETITRLIQWFIVNGLRIGLVLILTYLLIRVFRSMSPRMVSRITEKGKFTEEQKNGSVPSPGLSSRP